jgi:hypothetical protein
LHWEIILVLPRIFNRGLAFYSWEKKQVDLILNMKPGEASQIQG